MRALEDDVPPGTTMGATFAADIRSTDISREGGENYLAEFVLSYKGDGAVAVVNIEDFLDLVNPFTFTANNPRIRLRGRDIFALNVAWYGNTPRFHEGAIGEDDKVAGMRIPLQVVPRGDEPLTYSITRSAVTNLSGERLKLSLRSFESIPSPMPGRLDMREIALTTAASLGFSTLIESLPKIGRLMGLLIFSTTVPSATADLSSIQRLFLETPRGRFGDYHVQDMQAAFTEYYAEAALGALQDTLDNYLWVELREEPIDLVSDSVKLVVDVGVVSEAVRVIPVIEVAQGG